MDINCGEIVDGAATIETGRRAALRTDPDDRLGQQAKSERFGYGADEFVPWQLGAVM